MLNAEQEFDHASLSGMIGMQKEVHKASARPVCVTAGACYPLLHQLIATWGSHQEALIRKVNPQSPRLPPPAWTEVSFVNESCYLVRMWQSAPTQINPGSLLAQVPDTSTGYIRFAVSSSFVVHKVPLETTPSEPPCAEGTLRVSPSPLNPKNGKANKFQNAVLFALGVVPVRFHSSPKTRFSLCRRARNDETHQPRLEHFFHGISSLQTTIAISTTASRRFACYPTNLRYAETKSRSPGSLGIPAR